VAPTFEDLFLARVHEHRGAAHEEDA
jgi:hypothetical protein